MSTSTCEMRGGPKNGLRDEVNGCLYRRMAENPTVFVYVGVCDLCINPNER